MNRELFITIEGQVGTGKTHMMFLLEQFLIDNGFNVKLDLTNEMDDYGNEENVRMLYHEGFNARQKVLMKDLKITLKNKQMKRGSTQDENTEGQSTSS